jgi:hypothetical protein
MSKRTDRIKMARPYEPEVVETTIVGGQPPREGRSLGDVPRGVEVLIKKAAVDPAFKKILFKERAGAAAAIGLKLSPAEEAMLAAVPEAQLRAIIRNTKVSPNLRPAFLGATAGAMLAALGAAAYAEDPAEWEMRTTGIDPEIPPKVYDYNINDPADIDVPKGAGIIYGRVQDEFGEPFANVLVEIGELGMETVTNRHGFYVLTPVPPGSYNLTFSVIGYEPERRSNVEVRTGVKTDVSLKLFLEEEGHLITGIRPDQP